MAKVKINKLPDGFSISNGQIVKNKTMKDGGDLRTGDQAGYGLVTTPQNYAGDTTFNNSQDESVRYSLSSVPRDEANIEAEGGETVLTDLNDDGTFGLYDITGPRHGSGGVPMFLPEQSFIYSDTRKLKFTKDEMAEFGFGGQKKTPAKISKKFGLQEYYGELNSQFSDKISATSAELMLKKNMNDLSKLAFVQEAKKDFSDGVPLASHPYLVSIGEDPIEFTAMVEEITEQEAQQKAFEAMPPAQQQQIMMMQQMMAQQEQQQEQQQGQQGQPMQQPMQPDNSGMMPMARFGSELGDFINKAQMGKELTSYQDRGEVKEEEVQGIIDDIINVIQTSDGNLESVETIDVNSSQEKKITNSQGKDNPYKEGSVEHAKYQAYIEKGYSPTIGVNPQGKKAIKWFKPASEIDYTDRIVTPKSADPVVGEGPLSNTYSDDINTMRDATNNSGQAVFLEGMYSGTQLPKTQAVSGDYGYGSPEFFTKEAEEDFYKRNKGVTDKIDGFDYLMKRDADGDGVTDPAYTKQWGEFQNTYEDERKKYMEAQGYQYIPYFITDEEFKKNPGKYDADGDGAIDDEWSKRGMDSKAGGFTANAPGFDVNYSPSDTQYQTLADEPRNVPDNGVINAGNPPRKEMWRQDVNNMRALNAIEDNLYMPYAPVLENQKIDYVLDDYTGAVNANLASQRTTEQALGAYGAQAIARSNAQGKTLDANAKAINTVNSNNLRTRNQVGAMQPQIDMKVDMFNNKNDKQLYDNSILALQNSDNFDNWETAKYNELNNAAITNASNTFNLNSMYDGFNTRPEIGGDVEFTPYGRQLYRQNEGDGTQQRIVNMQRMKELGFEMTKENYELLYGPQASGKTQNIAQNQMQTAPPQGYGTKAQQGKEIKKKLSKWAVPFYTGKAGI